MDYTVCTYSPWKSPGQNTGVGSLSLLQGIFPTQGLNPGLPQCRQILYQLSHKGSWRILKRVAYPFSCRSSWPRNQTRVSCVAGSSLPSWAIASFLTDVGSWAKLLVWYTNWKLQTSVCDKMRSGCSVSSCMFSQQSQVFLWCAGLDGLKYLRFCSVVFWKTMQPEDDIRETWVLTWQTLDEVLCRLRFSEFSQVLSKVGPVTISILRWNKLEDRELRTHVQGHTASE